MRNRKNVSIPNQSFDNLEPRTLFATDINFSLLDPSGTRVYASTVKDDISFSGETDEYRVTITGGQKLSAVVQPIAGSTLKPRITIVSDDGSVTYTDNASSTVGQVIAQPMSLPAGSYIIRVSDNDTTIGRYRLNAYLNTGIENEPLGQQDNDGLETAIDLNSQSILLQASGRLANFHGYTDGSSFNSDLFRIDLAPGEALSALIKNPAPGFGQYQFETITQVLPVINTMSNGDFNNDGLPDVVIGGEGNFSQNNKLQVLLGDGEGGYSEIINWGGDAPIQDVVVGDFDDDNNLDVASINSSYSSRYEFSDGGSQLTIHHGDGTGQILYTENFYFDTPAYSIASGDFDHDDRPDIAVGHFPTSGDSGKISVLRNSEFGFESPTEIDATGAIYDIQSADINQDGYDDLITGEGNGQQQTAGYVNRYFMSSSTPGELDHVSTDTFEHPVLNIAIGDLNNDNYVDIVSTQYDTGSPDISVQWLNENGDVVLGYGQNIQDFDFGPHTNIALADVDRDGFLDLLSSTGDDFHDQITINLNSRNGYFFGGRSSHDHPSASGAFTLTDLNLDGDLDLIAGSTQRDNDGDDYSNIATRLGKGDIRVVLLDSVGNSILLSNSGGYHADQGILDFISSTGGTYYVRVIGDLGAEYQLGVTGGAKIGVDPDTVDGRSQDLTAAKQAIGHLENSGNTESYSVNIAAGDSITGNVIARNYGPGDPNNDLVPRIILRDASNNIVASDLNPANLPSASFNFTATQSGTYRVEISGNSGAGDYDVLVTGSNGPVPSFGVSGKSPAPGQVIDYKPYVFVDFNQPIYLPSVQASDLTLNGVPALSFGVLDGDTLYFQTDSLVTADGVYTVNIANGAITSSLGAPLTAQNWSFTVDQNGPRVLTSSITTNQTFAPGPLTWNVSFSEPIRRILDIGDFLQIILQPNDVSTTNLTTGQSVALSQMAQVTPPPNIGGDPTELNLIYNNLGEGLYEGRLISSQSAFSSQYAGNQFQGNPLDGEFTGTLPSGDGNKGGDFVVNFVVDAAGITPLNSLSALSPLGSLVHETATTRAFHATGDVDSFSLNLDPNQQVTITLVPNAGTSATSKLELKDPNGTSLGSATGAPGESVVLQSVNGTTGGTYQIDASSLNGTAGYTLRIVVNAAAEEEGFGGNNNARSGAQPMNMRTLAIGASGIRGAVLGSAQAGEDDYYRIDLVAGQPASFALSGIDGGVVAMRLEDPSGNFITNGASGQYNADSTIIDFVPTISGTFYVAVTGTGRYNLVATRAASFEREPTNNNTTSTQDLSISKQLLGNLKGGLPSPADGPIDVLQIGADSYFTSSSSDPNRLINQLNDDSYYNFNAVRGTTTSGDTLAELLAYDVVLLTGNANVTATPGIATALKQYIELGGAVVVVGFGGQYIQNTSMAPLRPAMPVDFAGGIGAITPTFVSVGSHPITNNVPTTTFPISLYRATGALPSNTTVLGTDNAGSPTLIIRDNIGFGGRSVFMGLEYAETFTANANVRDGVGDRLLEQTLAWAAQSGDQADAYTISANSGDNLVITTSLPNGETALPVNLLDPIIDLYSPSGILIASNDNALDGRNARLTYTVPAGQAGAYKAVVRGVTLDGGAYTIQVTGATGAALSAGPSVIATTPTAGQAFATPPTTIDITLSEPIQSNSISTTDLILSSGTVTNAQLIDGNKVRFTINIADVDTTYSYSIPAGAFNDLQGESSIAYSSNFVVDKRGPYVVSSNPSTQASSPFTSWSFTFNEPIAITWNNYTDIIDSFTGPGGTNLLASFVVNNITSSGNTLTISFTPRTAAGNYTLTLKPDRIKDLVGNKMDQDQDGVNGEVTADKYASTITLASPNLIVDTVQVLTPAVYGSPVTVQWTVRNNGTDPAADGWSDRLYLSADGLVDGGDLILLTIGTPTVPLAPGQTYTRTQTITLPLNTSVTPGTYRFIVRTDRSFNQAESVETDNDTASAATTVTLPDLPDLAVSNVQLVSPANPVSGGQATIQWTLTNTGTATISGVIRDLVSISSDDQPGADVSLAEVDYAVNLAPGQSVVRTLPVTIPINQFGSKWIIVKTDSNNTIFEHTNEANNTGVSAPVSINLAPIPDLIVTSITTPSNVTSGTTQTITWTLANQGSGDWNGTINENIFLSDDNTIGADTYYKTITFTGSIPAGQSITRSTTIDLAIQTNGQKWAVVQTDASNNVFENTGESNNTSIDDNPMSVVLPPTPDLVVGSITAPASTLSGRSVPITWTVRNDGTAPMNGTFASNVYLSSDDTIGNDQFFDTFTFTGTIAPGQTITQSQNIRLPNIFSGNYKVVVLADSGNGVFENINENNNTSIDDTNLEIIQAPYPNLKVSSITVPPTAQSQETVAINWVVSNDGDASTSSLEWYDYVYISNNPTLDGTDTQLARVRNASYLNAGESYQQNANITLPQGIQGTYYFIVKTDAENHVFEYQPNISAEGDNQLTSSGAVITLSPPPDLMVTSVFRPLVAISGELSTVSWTIANNGTGPTRNDQTTWTDQVWLSSSTTIDAGATLLGSFVHTGGLAVGASYNSSQQVRLPVGISGDYYFIVRTDSGNNVYEDAFEANNDQASGVTNILLAPPPDLHVTSIISPSVATSGRTLSVDFTVANEGSQTTPNTSWIDNLYISPTPTLEPSTAILIGQKGRNGALTAGQSYTATISGAIPLNITGTYYVFIAADAGNQVFELNNANNTVGSATELIISQSFSDLQISNFNPPSTAEAGTLIPLSFTVTNLGTGDTIGHNWSDQVVLSLDNVLGNGDDVFIVNQLRNGVLNAGGSYAVSGSFAIPAYVQSGTYNLFYATDRYNSITESNENNNSNAFAPLSIVITRQTPDLQVIDTTAPSSAQSGQTIAVSFTVKNLGSAATVANAWIDQLFLSTDGVIDNEDRIVRELLHTNVLAVGGQYTVNTTITTPVDYSGSYYLIARSDRDNAVIEGALDLNNDKASAPISIGLQSLPDLAVTNVTGPATANSGQTTSLTYTISNLGTDVAAGSFWYDTVYLSKDATLDRTDTALATNSHAAPMTGGTSYTDTRSVKLPPGLSGEYYLIVSADNTARIYERNQELNNVANSSAFQINLLPPADLVAGAIVLPVNGTPGQNATITYTVHNNSSQPAIGQWTDSLFISKDQTWDIGDSLFTRVDHVGDVPANDSYTHTVTAPLPGVTPGTYYLIVRSDILNQVPESIETNNLSASLDTILLDVPALVLDTPSNGTLSQDKSAYYRVIVPEGETLFIDLDAATATGSTQLYVKYNAVPSRSDFDFGYKDALASDQRITIPKTKAGTYYILAYGESLSAPTNYSIEARLLNFEITDTNYGIGGNGGKLTLQINGAKFDRTITPTLVSPGGGERAASQVFYTDSTRIYATFDLNGLTPNAYDVKLTKRSGATIILNDSLQVVPGTSGQAKPTIFAPESTSAGALFQWTVSWGNDGINDVPAPYLVVGADQMIGWDPDFINKPRMTFVGITQDDSPAGIIRPDQVSHREFYARNTPRGTPAIVLFADRLDDARRDQLYDWEEMREFMQSTEYSDEEFEPIFSQLKSDVGLTWGDFANAIANGSNYTPRDRSTLLDTLAPTSLNIYLKRAAAKVTTSLSGKLDAPDFEVPISNQLVVATEINTGTVVSTRTFDDGTFIFDRINPGSYRLTTDAGKVISGSIFTIAANQHLTGQALGVEQAGTISGTISRTADGKPVSGAMVYITGTDGKTREYRAASDGTYAISGLDAGVYTIYAESDGLSRTIVMGMTLSANGHQTQHFSLGAQATATGNVISPVGPNTELQVSAHLISITGNDTPAFNAINNGGQFQLAGLPAGQYKLNIRRQGYVSYSTEFNIASGQALNLGNINLSLGASVSGQIVATDTNYVKSKLLVGLVVGTSEDPALEDIAATTYTDSNGQFTFTGVPAGNFQLRLMEAGSFIQPVSVNVPAGGTVTGQQLVVQPGGSITGLVTNSNTGSALGNTHVVVSSANYYRAFLTNSAGQYLVKGLPQGVYTVSCNGTSTSVTISNLDGTSVNANLAIQYAGTVQGTITNSAGNAIVADVIVILDDKIVSEVPVDSQGQYAIHLIKPGTYSFVARSNYGSFNPVTGINIAGGTITPVNFVSGNASLNLTLTDTSSVEGTTVNLFSITTNGQILSGGAFLTASGNIIFTDLVPGQYRLEAFNTNNRGVSANFTIAPGSNSQTLALTSQGSMTGIVTSAVGGSPLAGTGVIIASTSGNFFQRVVSTDSNGAYTIGSIPPGNYALSIVKQGYQAYTQTGLVIAAGTLTAVNAQLQTGNSQITGRILALDGSPISNGQVTVTSADNTLVYGYATVNADGTFIVTGAVGTNLSVNITAPGGAAAVRTIASIINGATDPLGDILLDQYTLTAKSTISPRGTNGTGTAITNKLKTPIKPVLNDGDTDGPIWQLAQLDINNWKRKFDHQYERDLPPLDECKECTNSRQFAINMIILQDKLFNRGSDAVQQYSEAVTQARIHVFDEIISILGTAATAVLAAEAIVVAIPAVSAYAEANGLVYLANMGGTLGLGELPAAASGLNLAWAGAQVLGGLNAIYQAMQNVSNSGSFQSMYDQISDAANTAVNVGSLLNTVVEVLTRFTVENAKLVKSQTTGIGAAGGVLNLLSICATIKSFIEKCTFVESSTWSQLAAHHEQLFSNAKVKYWEYVEKANKAKYRYIACIEYSKLNCNGSKDNPFEIQDYVRPIPKKESGDPNDIVGPTGYGPEHYVQANKTLDYTIRFENMASATAPAQHVRITQILDSDLDVRSFRLRDFGFSGEFFDVPDNSAFYQTRMDLRETRGVYLDVVAGIDIVNHKAFWEFISIDPSTGEIPTNPNLGFLPTNVTSPEGEGFVQYTVLPTAGLSTGTVIDALATIVFDQNGPIDTPAIFNTLDAVAPSSNITALPPINADGENITVNWEGLDEANGSAIATFDVYVRTDDGPFQLWIDNTDLRQAVYTGLQGHTYSFYSVSVDNVGNVESIPAVADASTSIASTNHAPAIDVLQDAASIDEGSAFARSGVASDVDAGDVISATVDYGDGEGFIPLDLAVDGSFSLAHTYTDNGIRTISIRVTDSSNVTTEKTIEVTVNNVNPTIASIAEVVIPYDGSGGNLLVGGSFLDPGADTFTGLVDYGSGFVPLTLQPDGSFQLSNRYTTPGLYTVTVKVTDDDNGIGTQSFNVRLLPPKPNVLSLTVNDGNIQRSMVNTLTLTFDQAVTVPVGAVTLSLRSSSGPQTVAATLTIAQSGIDGKTWVISFSGTGLEGGSLADGVYDLAVNGSMVTDSFGQTLASSSSFSFHRLFGDSDGDRDADAVDQTRIRAVLNKPASFTWYFDIENDGDVDNNDFVAARLRFNKVLFS